jgi:formate hydrogenlyase subunit 4
LKLFVFFSLLANLFFPWGIATTLAFGELSWAVISLLLKLALLAIVVAVMETRVAKLRLFRVPELLTASFILALLAITSSFFLR